jgi:hypothetical protein
LNLLLEVGVKYPDVKQLFRQVEHDNTVSLDVHRRLLSQGLLLHRASALHLHLLAHGALCRSPECLLLRHQLLVLDLRRLHGHWLQLL